MSVIDAFRSHGPGWPEEGIPGWGERIVLAMAVIAQVVLRVWYVLNHRADFDEPQHLHVVWGWTQGLVQYRDLFDNHAPLFHLTMAPAVGVLGERADLLILARWMMLPLVGLTLWATYRIGRALWSPRVGLWAALLAGFVPSFLLTSTEFRTDVLWMTGWISMLAVLLCGPFAPRRAGFAGLLLGLTLATSLKTTILLLALVMAAMVTGVLCRRERSRALPHGLWRSVAWMAVGSTVVPLLVLAVFWRLHALRSLVYCTVAYNLVPNLGLWQTASHRIWILPAAFLILIGFLIALRRILGKPLRPGQVLVLLMAGLYLALLNASWPLITKQDFLPSTPLVALLLVAGAMWLVTTLERAGTPLRSARLSVAVMAAMCVIDVVALCQGQLPWRNANEAEDRMLRDVLLDTRPGEPIMDTRGETVFRPRPYYYVLEDVTESRLAMGLLHDRIADDVVRTRTHFAVPDTPLFPPLARRFLNEHFLPFGALRVLGKDLGDSSSSADKLRRFDVSYTERFAVLADGAIGRGALDGLRYRGPTLLRPGVHFYCCSGRERHVQVVWAGALGRSRVGESAPWRAD
jgi:hypothetical protein